MGGKLSHIKWVKYVPGVLPKHTCPKPAVISLSLSLWSSAFENKTLGSSWFGEVRKSPLQLLRDLDQVSGWNALLHPE